MKKLKIWWLKGRAKSAYLSYRAAQDKLSCGNTMAAMMPSVVAAKHRFNACLDRLSALDSSTPVARL